MSRRLPLLATAALAAASVLIPAGAAHADDEPHVPPVTPAQARQLCFQPWVGAGLGYNVINGSGLILGTSDPDLIIASAQPDDVYGFEGDDILCLFAADDEGHGGADNDIVLGFSGDDFEEGGPGDDRLLGDDGADDLNGNNGDDGHNGGAGVDTCNGGLGADVFVSC